MVLAGCAATHRARLEPAPALLQLKNRRISESELPLSIHQSVPHVDKGMMSVHDVSFYDLQD